MIFTRLLQPEMIIESHSFCFIRRLARGGSQFLYHALDSVKKESDAPMQ